MKKKVLVFGLGHATQKQNDVAVSVIDYLRKRSHDNSLELVDSVSCGKNLEECIESSEQLIVIDANHAKTQRESVRVYEGFEMDAFVKHRNNEDTHEAYLRDAILKASMKGKLPRHRALVGIQTAMNDNFDANQSNMNLAINRACQKVFEITQNWRI